MMFSKVTVTAPLNATAAERYARRIAVANVLAALGIAAAGLAGLIAAIRWW
ncbi:hypothetical protein [Comamonas testosteroni]|uniref:hypothetical protein n=1 Tax=Comamonas testosteroni TaxID=285 RepID=UPI0015F8EA05|nr:hypothetical protein [Comamonas testosteroni]